MADGLGQAGGQRRIVTPSYHHLPTGGNAALNPRTTLRNQVRAPLPLLRAKRSNPESRDDDAVDCFASLAMTNQSMTEAGISCAV
jgi:hypothetical protein